MDYLKEKFITENVVKFGHFELHSGKHSDTYVDKNAISLNGFLYGLVVEFMKIKILEWQFKKRNTADLITGTNTFGSHLASAIASGFSHDLGFFYPEVKKDSLILRPTYRNNISGKRIIIIDDVVTTGDSVTQLSSLITSSGGDVVSIFGIWNRGNVVFKNGTFLINERIRDFDRSNCQQCKNGVPLDILK